jgi:hypothetical protein
MRTTIILTTFLFLASSAITAGSGGGNGSNSSVQFSVTAEQMKLAPGGAGTLIFTLHPKAGIHINLEPGLTITTDSSSGVTLYGKPKIPLEGQTNYLDAAKPIRQSFRMPAHASSDTLTVSGTLTYYYCSDAEGWCSRFKQPFSLQIRIRQ